MIYTHCTDQHYITYEHTVLTLCTHVSVTSSVLFRSSLLRNTCFAKFIAQPMTGMSMISDYVDSERE
jgi:hypothetical protein